jgi:2-amino-4-hydroxy-6-hydroxymethyldihydropteridine diphosphokinase
MISKAYLLLGSNMGNSKIQFLLAHQHIEKNIGKILEVSSLYTTAAWGNENQPDFLNQIIVVRTSQGAKTLLKRILLIEEMMGRVRSIKNAPRNIDIDIIFFNNDVIDTKKLIVPHPEIQNRRFVLVPLVELSPTFVHPRLQKTVTELLNNCKDDLNVQKI